MRHSLFFRIQSEVEAHELYFIQKRDSAGRLGLSSLQKMTTALRILAYGVMSNLMGQTERHTHSSIHKSQQNALNLG
jgi:hypothetical protein